MGDFYQRELNIFTDTARPKSKASVYILIIKQLTQNKL